MSNPAISSPGKARDRSHLKRIEARGQRGLSAWLAIPEEADFTLPPLVAIHGLYRGAKTQARAFAPAAAEAGRVVIAPKFDQTRWSGYQQVVRRGRADFALMALMHDLRLAGIWQSKQFELVGYSGGAQFAHRFALLYPHLVSGVTLIGAGWYTFPDSQPFPYGFGASDSVRQDWGSAFSRGLLPLCQTPMRVYVGAQDNIVDANTRSGPKIDEQQGRTRLDRALRWVNAIAEAAKAKGHEAKISLIVIDGAGHDFKQCVALGEIDRAILTPSS